MQRKLASQSTRCLFKRIKSSNFYSPNKRLQQHRKFNKHLFRKLEVGIQPNNFILQLHTRISPQTIGKCISGELKCIHYVVCGWQYQIPRRERLPTLFIGQNPTIQGHGVLEILKPENPITPSFITHDSRACDATNQTIRALISSESYLNCSVSMARLRFRNRFHKSDLLLDLL